jgi:dienelactone hydrolase
MPTPLVPLALAREIRSRDIPEDWRRRGWSRCAKAGQLLGSKLPKYPSPAGRLHVVATAARPVVPAFAYELHANRDKGELSPGWDDLLGSTCGRGAVEVFGPVAEVLLFHHAQGQTPGFLEFADELRAAGHVVHAPDLYDGRTFSDLDEGVGYAKEVGFETILERGVRAADSLPSMLVYAGFSLGVMPAQKLAQTRPGAKGALLFSAALPVSEFGESWPRGVPVQIHMMEGDEWAEEDLPAARELTNTVNGAELFLYPGDRHLFADNSLPDYDESAATLLRQRVLAFLNNVQ